MILVGKYLGIEFSFENRDVKLAFLSSTLSTLGEGRIKRIFTVSTGQFCYRI